MNTSTSTSSRASRVPVALAAFSLVCCVLTLVGWATNVQRLADWDNDGIAQMPNSAIGVIAAALGLISALYGKRWPGRAFSAFAALIAFATLFEYAASIDLGIDRLVLHRHWGQRATTVAGRMGVPGAISLAIVGMSVLLFTFRRTRRSATIGGLITIAITMLSLIGYIFRADPLYTIPRFTAIALQTSTVMLALGLALVASVPERPPMTFLVGDSAGALFFRRALPVIVLLPVVAAWFLIHGISARLYDVAFGAALLVIVLIAVFFALTWSSAAAISLHEQAVRESRDREMAEQKNAERAIRESEQKFSLLFQKAAFGAALAKLPDGVFVDINESFTRMFGYTHEEAIGRTSLDLGISTDRDLRAKITAQLEREGVVRDVELRLKTRSGQERTFINNITIVEIGGEKHVLTTLQDITERKVAEDALRRSTESLLAADRMKDEFLATLSHEMRTPLTSIIGWSQILLNGDLDKRGQEIALQAIRTSAKAQAQITEDVLDVSRIITGKMRLRREDSDVAEVVKAAVEAVRPAAEAKRIAIRTDLDGALPRLFIDPERIRQVVWNLLSNAIKFSGEGTTVDVVLRRHGGSCIIEVADQGQGISRDFLPHVFERFRQADSSSTRLHTGLGIGLALAEDLVELHGGSISVESEEGHGSRFTVHLPLPMGTRSEGRPPEVTVNRAAATLRGIRVLYVEDRDDPRLLIATMLRQYGAEVIEAASVDDALLAVAKEAPDVVVTDLAMPGRDGYDLLAAMRSDRRWDRLPVLALTAQVRIEDEARASVAGFSAFLRKPIESQDLAAAIARVMAGQPA